MTLTLKQKEAIVKHALEEYPNECCGFLTLFDIMPCKNKASDKSHSFIIDPVDYLKAKNGGCWAVYHSHPNGSCFSSANDRFCQTEYAMPLVTYSVEKESFSYLDKNGQDGYSFQLKNEEPAHIKPSTEERVRMICTSRFPEEACGAVLLDGQVVELENSSADRINFFRIKGEDVARYKNQIHYIFHSHCKSKDAGFSDVDLQVSDKSGMKLLLYNVISDKFLTYHPNNSLPLEGRVFAPGILDCVTLASDYYWEKLNIKLPQIKHPFRNERMSKTFYKEMRDKWQHENRTTFLDFYLDNGFYAVSEPVLHDLVVSNCYEFVDAFTHVSVYLGEGKILDYGPDLVSKVTTLQDFMDKSFGSIIYLRKKDAEWEI